jgi:hypothetical protein
VHPDLAAAMQQEDGIVVIFSSIERRNGHGDP